MLSDPSHSLSFPPAKQNTMQSPSDPLRTHRLQTLKPTDRRDNVRVVQKPRSRSSPPPPQGNMLRYPHAAAGPTPTTPPPPPSSSSTRHADMDDDDDAGAGACGRVLEWERGLPTAEELTPLSQPLIPPALAAAFRIHVRGTAFDFPAAVLAHDDSPTSHLSLRCEDECEDGDGEDWDGEEDDEEEEAESEDATSGSCRGGSGAGSRAGNKKARMVWTPELHHRFVEAVAHLGDKGAVPKAIVRLMNVDGLSRENVASHLQKYRIYLKRTRSPAKPQPPPAFPPAYGSHFRPQHPCDTSSRSGYCAFSSRDSDKLERDKAGK